MKYLVKEIPEDHGYLIPIGDLHIGDKSFSKEGEKKLIGYLSWVAERPNAFIFLMGDIFNVAGRNTKTTPFETDVGEYEKAIELFKPYKEKIIGALDGNHEYRMIDEFGISPMQLFCRELNVPYCKYSAMIRFKVGKREDDISSNRFRQNYFVYGHHTSGGGTTIGGKLNRVAKLSNIVEGCDVLLGGHNHQLAVAPQDVFYPSSQGGIKKRRIWYVDCGSYLSWDNSYAEKGMMPPSKLGSPRIRLDGKIKDCHISL
ncbi:MAG: hypothetical protein PHS93_09070 [Candidatus Omnitrophica bacterium]|nr:hypothetical protein [Candidatus Omnitrophota bacterium]MDD5551288.1 hypothetical protein [Candidatus Omnitrophota bacterium]